MSRPTNRQLKREERARQKKLRCKDRQTAEWEKKMAQRRKKEPTPRFIAPLSPPPRPRTADLFVISVGVALACTLENAK